MLAIKNHNKTAGYYSPRYRIFRFSEDVDYNQVADLIILPTTVHFNKDSIANVLSFKKISELPGVRITTDTGVEKAFFVHTKEGEVIKFLACKDGLYYHDVSAKSKSKASVNSYSQHTNNVDDIKNVMLVSTVNNNKAFYTKNK